MKRLLVVVGASSMALACSIDGGGAVDRYPSVDDDTGRSGIDTGSSFVDSTVADTGSSDGSGGDTTTTVDSTPPADTTTGESATDTGPVDTGPVDTGGADTGSSDTGAKDTGSGDACTDPTACAPTGGGDGSPCGTFKDKCGKSVTCPACDPSLSCGDYLKPCKTCPGIANRCG